MKISIIERSVDARRAIHARCAQPRDHKESHMVGPWRPVGLTVRVRYLHWFGWCTSTRKENTDVSRGTTAWSNRLFHGEHYCLPPGRRDWNKALRKIKMNNKLFDNTFYFHTIGMLIKTGITALAKLYN